MFRYMLFNLAQRVQNTLQDDFVGSRTYLGLIYFSITPLCKGCVYFLVVPGLNSLVFELYKPCCVLTA